MSINNQSACNFLFGADAVTIFENFECNNKEEFVNESLEILMKINRCLLTHKDAFALVDPMAKNNQCHLYALKAVQIQRKYGEMSEEEKSAQTPENRYLHLAIFLNYAVATEAKTFENVVTKALVDLSIQVNNKQLFSKFLRDQGDFRKARIALNNHFKDDLRARFNVVTNHLYEELGHLSEENLINQGLYTFPKLAGVAYLIDRMAMEDIPFVIKVKILTAEGAAGVILQSSRKINLDEPVIVLEGFANDGSMKLLECEREAKKCHKYFFRNVQTNQRHKELDCFYCKAVQIDLVPYRARLSEVMKRPEDMFYALGADFIDKIQPEFQTYFSDRIKFPLLNHIYVKGQNLIGKLGLGMDCPTTFSVCHAYCDTGARAVSEVLQLDMTHEEFLQNRGIL